MTNKLWLTAASITALILGLVTFQSERSSFAGAPLKREYNRVKGPDLEGALTVIFVEKAGGASALVVAKCKSKEFVVGPLFYPSSQPQFAAATKTKAELEVRGWTADGAAPAGCYSKAGGETLLLYKVDRFDTHTDKAVVAKVKVRVVQVIQSPGQAPVKK